MAIRLAQEIPSKLKAFAAIVASNPVNSKCANSKTPISALFMNGTNDPFLPYLGGQMTKKRGKVLSTEKSIKYWIERNQTDTTATIKNITNLNKRDKSKVKKIMYSNGLNNTEVILYKILDGGHTEPSIDERYGRFFKRFVGEQNGDIEMAHQVWNFFKTK